ncbi:neuronal acetylcholine receptor subunit alpha-4-like [Glandiceps talaboti]
MAIIEQVVDGLEAKELHTLSETFKNCIKLKKEHVGEWDDYRLRWNPLDYHNITLLVVPVSYIWNPDTSLLNSAEGDTEGYPRVHLSYLDVQIFPNGHIMKVTPGILRTPCLMDITYFPVDRQRCYFEFGLWKYFDRLVELYTGKDEAPKENYIANVEWEFLSSSAEANKKSFLTMEGGNDSFTSIIITIDIQRKPLYYVLNVILPCIVVSVLSTVSFCLPSSSPEKLDLSISLLLTMYVFNLLVIDLLPATSSSVPYLTRYLLFNMSMIGCSVASTMLVLKVHKRQSNDRKMPQWIRKVFLEKLATILFVHVRKYHKPDRKSFPKSNHYVNDDNMLLKPMLRSDNDSPIFCRINKCERNMVTPRTWCATTNSTFKFPSKLQPYRQRRHCRCICSHTTSHDRKLLNNSEKMVDILDRMAKHFIPTRSNEQMYREWVDLASVLDRLLLVVFLIIFLIGAGLILPQITG